MRRYERQYINEVCCGNSSIGPYLKIDGKKKRTYIIALLGDASRMITSIDIFMNDNFVNLMSVMRNAITTYGKPKVFNFDNGSPYKNKQLSLLGARLGVSLNYCAPYTPTSKSKIERWFRSMKDHWMSTLNMKDFNSLEELRKSLYAYVDQFHHTVHSSLSGCTPSERFFQDSERIIRLPAEQMDTFFLLEIERRVSADNVIVIDQEEYEVHYRYARQRITLRYSADMKQVYIVGQNGTLEEIKLLDKHENAHIKREKIKYTGGEECHCSYYGIEYDPFIKNTKDVIIDTSEAKEVRYRLDYLKETKGFGLLTGQSGRDKTTIVRAWASALNSSLYKVVYIPLSTTTVQEFYRQLAAGLGAEPAFRKVDNFRAI